MTELSTCQLADFADARLAAGLIPADHVCAVMAAVRQVRDGMDELAHDHDAVTVLQAAAGHQPWPEREPTAAETRARVRREGDTSTVMVSPDGGDFPWPDEGGA